MDINSDLCTCIGGLGQIKAREASAQDRQGKTGTKDDVHNIGGGGILTEK